MVKCPRCGLEINEENCVHKLRIDALTVTIRHLIQKLQSITEWLQEEIKER